MACSVKCNAFIRRSSPILFLLLSDANIVTDAVEDTAARSCVHVTSTMASVTHITDSRQILLYVQQHMSLDSATVAGDAFQLPCT